jgi:hypothetical protein
VVLSAGDQEIEAYRGEHLVLWQATSKISLVVLSEQTLEILALATIRNELRHDYLHCPG